MGRALLPAGNTALSHCRLFASHDVDETRQQIARVMQPHVLRPIGRVRARRSHMDYLRLPGLGIGTIGFGGMEVNAGRIDGYHLLILCLSGNARIRSAGTELGIGGHIGLALAPDDPFHGEFSDDCEQLVIRIEPETIAAHTGIHAPRFDRAIDVRRAALRPWLNLMNLILADEETIRLIRTHPLVAADYEQLFVRLLLAGHPARAPDSTPQIAPSSVRRAEMFMREHAGQPLRLRDIAAAVDLPERTLHNGFRRFRGASPMQFLRDIRLDRVRAQLQRPDNAESIAAVAFEHGFGHLGRFARDYRHRFGEKPSETAAATMRHDTQRD